jgi:hypothetical protein
MNTKNKKAQGMKSKISPASPFGKKAQEEMVGFALILVLVAVILVVFLVAYIKKPQTGNVGSPEVNSFVQSFLQYTTTCEEANLENISVQGLIFKCQKKEKCSYNQDSCRILNDTLKGIVTEGWKVSPINPVKGYSLIINVSEKQFLNLTSGVVTNNYEGSEQDFGKGDEFISILFNAYS